MKKFLAVSMLSLSLIVSGIATAAYAAEGTESAVKEEKTVRTSSSKPAKKKSSKKSGKKNSKKKHAKKTDVRASEKKSENSEEKAE
jgi:hypothetical protein